MFVHWLYRSLGRGGKGRRRQIILRLFIRPINHLQCTSFQASPLLLVSATACYVVTEASRAHSGSPKSEGQSQGAAWGRQGAGAGGKTRAHHPPGQGEKDGLSFMCPGYGHLALHEACCSSPVPPGRRGSIRS